ncbi:MAG: hypothetical protein WAU01_00155 [Saprospiraceae bacterium]
MKSYINKYLPKVLTFTLLSFVLVGSLQAQAKVNIKEKMMAQKAAYITQQLELNENEAQKFWPIYNSYQSELDALKSEMKIKPSADMSDKEAEDMMYALLDTKAKEIDIQKKYIQKMKTVISAKRIAMLFKAERGFKEKVISNIKDRKRGRKEE